MSLKHLMQTIPELETKTDKELDAIETSLRILVQLPKDGQKRIMKYLVDRFGMHQVVKLEPHVFDNIDDKAPDFRGIPR